MQTSSISPPQDPMSTRNNGSSTESCNRFTRVCIAIDCSHDSVLCLSNVP